MGLQSLAADVGIAFDIVIKTDTSAALGVKRRMCGRCGHHSGVVVLKTHFENQKLKFPNVHGERNVADILTKTVKAHGRNEIRQRELQLALHGVAKGGTSAMQ